MKAFLYCRVSTLKQSQEAAYGIKRQSETVLDYLSNSNESEKLGYKLSPDNYEMLDPDLGKSGYHGYNFSRGSLGRFKQRVANGEITSGALVIENADRFCRRAEYDASDEFNFLINRGIDIHEVETGNVYSKKLTGTLSKLAHAIERAHGESERKSKMATKSWKNRHKITLEQGVALKTNHPRWLKIVGDHYEIIPEQKAIFKHIFEKFLEGYGISVLLDYLNGNEIRNLNRRWTRTSLHHILRDKRLIGYNKELLIYPVAIDIELFNRVQDRFDSTDDSAKRRTTKNMRNVFNGMTKCFLCGGAMISNRNPHGKYHLYCVTKRADKHACSASACRYEFVEKEVLQHLLNVNWSAVYSKDNKTVVDTDSKKIELAELTRKIEDLENELKDASAVMVVALVRAIKEFQKEQQKIKDELAIISTEVTAKFSFNIEEVIDQSNVPLRQEINLLLRKTVHRIFVHKNSGFIFVSIKYYNSVLTHLLVLENKTGELKANITVVDTVDKLRISSGDFAVWLDKEENIWNIDNPHMIGSADFFLVINHMSQYVEQPVIDDLLDMWTHSKQ